MYRADLHQLHLEQPAYILEECRILWVSVSEKYTAVLNYYTHVGKNRQQGFFQLLPMVVGGGILQIGGIWDYFHT